MKWDAYDDIRTPAAWLDQAKELTETPRSRRRTWSPRAKGALLAACLCAAVVGTAFAAALIWGTPVTIILPDETNYLVQADITHLSPEEYSPAIQSALAALDPDDPNSGNNLYQDSWADCADFLGFDLLGHPWLDYGYDWSGSGHDMTPDNAVDHPFYANVTGADGHLQWAEVRASRRVDGVEFSLGASIYGEGYPSDIPTMAEGWDAPGQSYQMACGLEAQIVTSQKEPLTQVYFATEHVQYWLTATVGEEGGGLVREYLDQFYAIGDNT